MIPEGTLLTSPRLGTFTLGPGTRAGGSASVHASQMDDGTTLAVKVHQGSKLAATTWRAANEAKLIVVPEPGLLPPTDSFVVEFMERHYTCLLMEYFPHEELGGLFHEERNNRPPTISIAKKLLMGLNNLHRQGVVHGDLSPSNVLVDRTDLTVNIIDFETAWRADGDEHPPEAWDREEYRSPEVTLHGVQALNFGSDVWACGLILLQMFAPKAWAELQARRGWGPIFSSRQDDDHDDPAGPLFEELTEVHNSTLEALILGMLIIDPARRWSTIQAYEAVQNITEEGA